MGIGIVPGKTSARASYTTRSHSLSDRIGGPRRRSEGPEGLGGRHTGCAERGQGPGGGTDDHRRADRAHQQGDGPRAQEEGVERALGVGLGGERGGGPGHADLTGVSRVGLGGEQVVDAGDVGGGRQRAAPPDMRAGPGEPAAARAQMR